MIKMAVEVGGTFTDLIWIAGGEVRSHKVPSTQHDASVGVVNGLEAALGDDLMQVSELFHGSTVATNAVLERKGCRAAFVTTHGFRDLLLIQRQLRPNVYAIACRKPEPLIPLSRSVEVRERLGATGELITPLDEAGFVETLDLLMQREAPEALAVCLLHSYRDGVHERRLREIVAERYPDLPVVLSSEVLPTFREYERASTSAMAAYLVPLVGRYLARLEDYMSQKAPDSDLFVMQSSGGVLPSSGSRDRGVDMLNSGPAAGVIGAVRVSELVGARDVITLDIGGTSSDICLIAGGVPGVTSETEVDGLPVGLPSIDIANIGAGGGSLGWIDPGGMLQVGPRSAGALPGPACYGHGGTVPAITDALVELGWIRPHRFLGGRMTLQPQAATLALDSLGNTASKTAQAMIDIATAHIGQGIRLVSVQRGHDPKDYALFGYGGMGPMISALTAEDLKIGRVVIPPYPGLFSALGLLVCDLRRIYRETNFMPVDDGIGTRALSAFELLRERALAEFDGFGHPADAVVFEHALEMRYQGQGFELLAEIDAARLALEGRSYLEAAFQDAHRARYGAVSRDPVEVVTLRLVAQVPADKAALGELVRGPKPGAVPEVENGAMVFRNERTPCSFAWRSSLPAGFVLHGAAVIEEPTATTLVPPGWSMTVHATGALVLTPEAR